ncbi:MAG TPA: ATP-dependent DNA helicase RecG, partial [Castellaniella sp.]|nr:ATP-dependent DNA helicase RecG [Castellaniella sp.]
MLTMEPAAKTPAEQLAMPLQFVKGVGPQRAELLAKLGLEAVRDVLFFFPRDYQDLTQLTHVADFQDDALVNVQGVVEEFELRNTSQGRSLFGVLLREATGAVRGVWFNQPYLVQQFRQEQRVLLTGRVKQRGLVWEMTHPRVQWLEGPAEEVLQGILPVYPLCEGLNQHRLREIVRTALAEYAGLVEEVFPDEFLTRHELWPIRQALPQVHFPESKEALHNARRRFVYQELFILQLALGLRRRLRQGTPAPPLEATARIDARIRRLFPFELTAGQQQAIADVAADMAGSVPMNRLLQGDVGSGKTMVAVYALLVAVAHGQQAALMAPTEILARQHFDTLGRLLVAGRVRVGLLVGGLTGNQRSELLAAIAAGEIDVVLGTQAIIQEDVQFARLGLVVIDEQHKFGVRQRAKLKEAALSPHYLVMTATPIPRTVSLTVYGDLDVTVLRDSPPGRQNIHTYLAQPEQREKWWEFFRKKLREGRQGYVVAPLVEESDRVAAANLAETFEA